MKNKRKKWFEFVKSIIRVFIKKTQFIYLGEPITNGAIVISNHEGTKAPLAWELYCDIPLRFWGAYEMNNGLVSLYKYQTRVYYHEKKHWNLFLARLFCLLASPLTNMFYKGLEVISTYKDSRFKKTIRQSVDAIKSGQNVILFPEDSKNGYLPQLEGLHGGFLLFASACLKQGIDAPLYLSYYKKDTKQYVVDKPVMLSELFSQGKSRECILSELLDRINALGAMDGKELLGDQQNTSDNVA